MAAVSALLALCSSLLWGTSDFVAGLKAKTMPAAAVLRTTADAPKGTRLRVRVADGAVTAVSQGPEGPLSASAERGKE